MVSNSVDGAVAEAPQRLDLRGCWDYTAEQHCVVSKTEEPDCLHQYWGERCLVNTTAAGAVEEEVVQFFD